MGFNIITDIKNTGPTPVIAQRSLSKLICLAFLLAHGDVSFHKPGCHDSQQMDKADGTSVSQLEKPCRIKMAVC